MRPLFMPAGLLRSPISRGGLLQLGIPTASHFCSANALRTDARISRTPSRTGSQAGSLVRPPRNLRRPTHVLAHGRVELPGCDLVQAMKGSALPKTRQVVIEIELKGRAPRPHHRLAFVIGRNLSPEAPTRKWRADPPTVHPRPKITLPRGRTNGTTSGSAVFGLSSDLITPILAPASLLLRDSSCNRGPAAGPRLPR